MILWIHYLFSFVLSDSPLYMKQPKCALWKRNLFNKCIFLHKKHIFPNTIKKLDKKNTVYANMMRTRGYLVLVILWKDHCWCCWLLVFCLREVPLRLIMKIFFWQDWMSNILWAANGATFADVLKKKHYTACVCWLELPYKDLQPPCLPLVVSCSCSLV